MATQEKFGRSIKLFLTDGTPSGVITGSMANWTGKVLVGRSANLPALLSRSEVSQPGVYILQGPDPDTPSASRVYIGEGEVVGARLKAHAETKGFWEVVCVITVTDESLTKGHVQYLESRLIALAHEAQRVRLDNGTSPQAMDKPLPEADRADMEYFLSHLRVVLPVVGFDFLKPNPASLSAEAAANPAAPKFEIRHKNTGIQAFATEVEGEFVVLAGSQAAKDAGYQANTYSAQRAALVKNGSLSLDATSSVYVFTRNVPFASPSAAAAAVLDRNANGRVEWKVVGTNQTYREWQDRQLDKL